MSRVLAHLAAAADEGLLLCEVPPVAGQGLEPDVVGIPGQGRAGGGKGAEAVVDDGALGDFGEEWVGVESQVSGGMSVVGWKPRWPVPGAASSSKGRTASE
jgi:hypothetical protein